MKSAFDYSISILTKRARSEAYIRNKLLAGNYPADEIEESLERLRELHYVDDAAYINDFINSSVNMRRGRLRIVRDLEKDGFDKTDYEEAMADLLPYEVEFENAEHEFNLLLKKNGPLLDGSEDYKTERKIQDKIYRRAVNKLKNLGYDNQIIYELTSRIKDYLSNS